MRRDMTILLLNLISVLLSGCSIFKHANVSQAPRIPIARAGHAGGIVDGRVFIAGGNNWSADRKTKNWLADSYYFENGKWNPGPTLPSANADMAYASDRNCLYLCGGNDGLKKLNSVYRFKTINSPPEALESLPVALDCASAAILDSYLYVIGGVTQQGLTSRMYKLDISAKNAQWRECHPLPGPPREWHATVVSNGYLYVLGGVILQDVQPTLTVLQDAYRYDSTTDKWQKMPGLPLSGYAWSAVDIDKKHALVTGRAFENSTTSPDIFLVDLDTMTMNKMGELALKACAAPLVKTGSNTWWYIGGEPETNRSRTSVVSIISLVK